MKWLELKWPEMRANDQALSELKVWRCEPYRLCSCPGFKTVQRCLGRTATGGRWTGHSLLLWWTPPETVYLQRRCQEEYLVYISLHCTEPVDREGLREWQMKRTQTWMWQRNINLCNYTECCTIQNQYERNQGPKQVLNFEFKQDILKFIINVVDLHKLWILSKICIHQFPDKLCNFMKIHTYMTYDRQKTDI